MIYENAKRKVRQIPISRGQEVKYLPAAQQDYSIKRFRLIDSDASQRRVGEKMMRNDWNIKQSILDKNGNEHFYSFILYSFSRRLFRNNSPVMKQEKKAMKQKPNRRIFFNSKHYRHSLWRSGWVMLLILALVFSAFAQEGIYSDNKADQTLRSNGRVNPSTLALEISVPLASYPGRGINVPISLSYSSKVWRIQYTGEGQVYNTPNCYTSNLVNYAENSASGWTSSLGLAYIEYTGEDNLYDEYGKPLAFSDLCTASEQYQNNYVKRVQVHLPGGESHELRASDQPVYRNRSSNTPTDMTGTYYSVDGSKMKFVDDGNGTYRLYLPDGSTYDFASSKTGLNGSLIRKALLYKDVNGNQLTFNAPDGTYPNGSWTDTMGRIIPVPISPTEAPSAPETQNYQLPGMTNPYKLVWKQLKGAIAEESGLTDFNQNLKYKGDIYQLDTLGRPQVHPSGEVLFHSDSKAKTFDYSTTPFNPIVLTEIELPNGSKYKFSYNIYGEIERIKYPTGGEEHLTFGQVNPIDPVTLEPDYRLPYDEANRGVTQRQVYENPNAAPSTWTYATGTEGSNFKATINNPDGTRTERILISANPCTLCQSGDFGFGFVLSGMPIEERNFSSANLLLSKKLTTWTKTEHPVNISNKNAEWHPRVTKEESIIYDPATGNALSSSTTTDYAGDLNAIDNPVNVSKTTQYGYTTTIGSLGSLEKSVETDYLSNPTYDVANLKSLPTVSRIKDSAGNIAGQSQIEYDEAGYGSGGTRGQPTTSRSWTDVAANQYIESHVKYDAYGNVIQAIDAKGNATTTEYSGAYNYAYPTKVTTPVPDPSGSNGSNTPFETSSTYDLTTGLTLTTTDANGQTTSMEYNDPLLRPTKVIPPAGGAQTVMEYTDTPNAMSVKTKTQIDETNWAESTVYADGLGRSIKSEKKDDQGNVFTETEYDVMGRVKQVTNPYRAGETVLWTENTYDDLSRIIKVTTPDNAEVNTAYDLAVSGTLGTTVTVTDQAGKQRRSLTNALGQLTRVDEPDDSGNLGTVDSPVQPTSYSYDTLSNLTTVNQGVQTRNFQYDSLSRLKQATNPESGTIFYTYDNNGNLTQKTDARSISTTYAYDNLNRVISRTYSDGTPQISYVYDDPANTFSKGKLTKVSSSVSETKYNSFDNLGRVLTSQQITDGQTYNFGYAYNLAGMLVEETYPSGRKVKNSFQTDGDLAKVETLATGGSYAIRADNFSYTSAGAVSSMMLGNSRWETAQFNSRLQPVQLGLGSSANAQDLWKVDYDYGTTDNNGNVKQQTITIPSINSLIQTYTYDSLNRIKSATETQNTSETWKQTFTYDRYGNRNFDAANTTTLGSCSTVQCNPQVDAANNRFTTNHGYTYDLSGNLITDPQNRSFVYDAENKQSQVKDASNNSIGTYFYDGDGKRVKKVSSTETTLFAYDASGKLAAEYLMTESTLQPATTSYLTSDTLGSPRVITDQAGNVTSRRDFMPFGEEIANLGGRTVAIGYQADSTRQKFTGYERDDETDLDFAQARMHNKNHGRFNSADEPLADQGEEEPQTWNLYVYGGNNPMLFTDPTGMWKWLDPDKNGNRFVQWEDGDNWETLAKFLYDETGQYFGGNQLSDFYSGSSTFGESLVLDLGNFDGRPYPGPHGLEDSSWDFVPIGRAGGVVQKTGVLQRIARTFGFGAAKQTARKTITRATLNVIQEICFVAGTPILTENGLKPIEDIKAGDEVLSYNEQTKQTEYKTVVQTFIRFAEAEQLLSVKVEGEAAPLGVTDEHPFYVRVTTDKAEWKAAKELKTGDEIKLASGGWAKVQSISLRSKGEKVYNFEVADNHNYFVGRTSLLAHNNCKKYLQKAIRAAKPQKNGDGIEHIMQDGTKLVFRKDTGAAAHAIGKKYPNAVDHYNIEVHVPYRGGFQKTTNAHLILDKTGNVVDVFTK